MMFLHMLTIVVFNHVKGVHGRDPVLPLPPPLLQKVRKIKFVSKGLDFPLFIMLLRDL